MRHRKTIKRPPRRWWDKPMPATEFLARMADYTERRYNRSKIDFTHDVLLEGRVIGQAAWVESLYNTRIHVAVVSIGDRPAIYQVVDSQFELRRKAQW